MIYLLAGRPKSGKSYEAVKYHVIPALKAGRKVITNLPLQLDHFKAVFGPHIIDLIRLVDYDTTDFNSSACHFPFSRPDDYITDWRHPDTGQGPLVVVDEAHFAIPRGGTGKALQNFFTMHGHYGLDILLMSQQPGQIDRQVRELIEVCYRTIKNTALGSTKTYTKKVTDGYRGAVVNTEQRTYDKKIFKFYKAFTQSDGAPEMHGAADVKPFWRHWSVYGAVLFLGFGVPMLINTLINHNPLKPHTEETQQQPKQPPVIKSRPSQPAEQSVAKTQEKPKEKKPLMPYGKVDLHISGFIQGKSGDKAGQFLYQFVASQNGQPVFNLSHYDLINAGYSIESLGSCAARITYKDYTFTAICDSPRVGVNLASNFSGHLSK